MITTNQKLETLAEKIEANVPIKIAILGLGSVGNYLLNYLLDFDHKLELHLIGRSKEKIECDVNIALVAANIRRRHSTTCFIHEADFNNIPQLTEIFKKINPDFIVNASRAYSHLKYGSISWNTVRAYGVWSPLSVKYVKSIMKAVQTSETMPIVINTSYSDAVNAWIKTSGASYPDFGSGNLNHLIPRMRFAIARDKQIDDYENIQIILATSHFHDVVISKEGQTEGVDPLVAIRYKEKELSVDLPKIFSECAIPMPVDAKRNMMNASSNYEIITTLINSIKTKLSQTLHIPGAMGMVGGFPINIIGGPEKPNVEVNEDYFSLRQMEEINRKSIYLDGIENVENGILSYTDELMDKVKGHFKYNLPKQVNINDSDEIASEIIENIIDQRP
jgi:hypothetical protein